MTRHTLAACIAVLFIAPTALTGCGTGAASINGSVKVDAGESAGDIATVNGGVEVEDGATVKSAMSVNGAISLGTEVIAGSVNAVNGDVTVGRSSRVTGDVKTVNGAVTLEHHSEVLGSITTVNGAIQLNAAHVGNGLTTYNGDMEIRSGSLVEGGIYVKKPRGNPQGSLRVPRIVIGPHTRIRGPLRFEHEVRLYVSDHADIAGKIEGAMPQHFSGEEAPG